jgi:DNA-binding SARP family transcriptional activator
VAVSVHVQLTGPLRVRASGTELGPADFPGRQGRLVFAALVRAGRPVDRNELAEILWPNRLPSSWTRDLSAIVSKLRVVLDGTAAITTGNGRWYAVELPAGTTVDVDSAAAALARAERARDAGEIDAALDAATRVAELLREPFLAGDDCPWIDECRFDQHELRVRALTCRTEMLVDTAGPAAVATARELVDAAPEREHAHVLLMRAQLAGGDRVGAARSYEQLRRLLADDFGLSPSAAAEAVLREALGPDEPGIAPREQSTPVRHRVPLPPPVGDARRTPMVGRARALGSLDPLLARSASARLAAIVGPAGIGKSRLACEIASRAHDDGSLVAYGACRDGPVTPYLAIVDAFTAMQVSPGIDADVRDAAAEIVVLLATGDTREPGGHTPTELLAALARSLHALAGPQTVVLVVDDVQWADDATVRAIEFLLRVVPQLRIVATCRPLEPHGSAVADLLSALRASDAALFVPLEGLSRTDVAETLAVHGTRDVDAALARAVHDLTGGNPLYVREIGRHLAVAGRPQPVPGGSLLDAVGLPRGLAELIDANVARLGSHVRRVLETAAVISGPVEPGVLRRSCGVADDDLLTAVDVARRAGVLVEDATGGGAVRFEHPLVREVILQGLGSTRRAQLHQRVAEAIEAFHRDDVDRYAAELAHHLAAAANVGSAHDAIEFATRAGERANAVCAYEEAVHWFAHALRLAHAGGEAPEVIARRLTALGDAQNHVGDAAAARMTLLDAIAAARGVDDPVPFARAVLGLGAVLVDEGFEGGMVEDRLVDLLEEAMVRLPDGAPLRTHCAVRLAQELHFSGARSRCLALCADAEARATRADDPEVLAAVLGARHYALYGTPDVGSRLELLARIATLRSSVRPDPRWLRDYLELGDLDAADAAARHLERQVAASGIASDRYYPAVWRATRAALRGELEVAEAAAGEAAEIGRNAARGPVAVAGVWAAQIFTVRLFDGRLAELVDLVDAAAAATPTRPIWRAAAAFLHHELGDDACARAHLDHLRRTGFEALPDTLDRPLTLALLAWVVADLGALTDVRALRHLVRPYRDLLVVLGAAAPSVCAGPMTFPLAMLEARLGRQPVAAACFADAVAATDRIDAPRWRDRIQRAWADAMLRAVRSD